MIIADKWFNIILKKKFILDFGFQIVNSRYCESAKLGCHLSCHVINGRNFQKITIFSLLIQMLCNHKYISLAVYISRGHLCPFLKLSRPHICFFNSKTINNSISSLVIHVRLCSVLALLYIFHGSAFDQLCL